MIVLSFAGGPNAVHERTFEIFPEGMHDGAAVLLKDGEVVAAIEQERLDRLKHSNKRPFDAIRCCLRTAGIDAREVDRFAFHSAQSTWDTRLADYALNNFDMQLPLDARVLIRALVHRSSACSCRRISRYSSATTSRTRSAPWPCRASRTAWS